MPRWFLHGLVRMTSYAELVCASNYSFLRGASPPAELIEAALRMNYRASACATAIPSQASCARSARWRILRERRRVSARAKKFKFLAGARLVFFDGAPDVAAYPPIAPAGGNCAACSRLAKRRAKKGECLLRLDDLLADAGDLLLIAAADAGFRQSGANACPSARANPAGSGLAPTCRAAARTAAVSCACASWRGSRASNFWRRMTRFTPVRKTAPCRMC